MKRIKISLDEVIIRNVTCPFCKTWISSMRPDTCSHFKEWDKDYAYFEEDKKKCYVKNVNDQ